MRNVIKLVAFGLVVLMAFYIYLWSLNDFNAFVLDIENPSNRHVRKIVPSMTSCSTFDIICLTMNRVKSLQRLLDSIEASSYDNETVRLIIKIDLDQSNATDKATKELAESFNFSHGPKQVSVATVHQGLRAAWLNAWKPNGSNSGCAIILEDDVEVSPIWYKYVRGAWAVYQSNPVVGGISLNRQQLVPDKKSADKEIVNRHKPFLYKLVGSQGFSPNPIIWAKFLKWVDSIDLGSFQANVPGLVTSDWYKQMEKASMWTQLFIYFCNEHELYILYVNLPSRQTLAAHWREKGEHFKTTGGRDFELAINVSLHFPKKPAKYGWDGMLIEEEENTLFNQPKLAHAGTQYGGWTYNETPLNQSSIVYSIGLGEDTSWDEEIIRRYNLTVWGFDPTPKSLSYVKGRKELHDGHFHLVPEGLSTVKKVTTFTFPKNPNHVSMREGVHSNLGSTINVTVNTLDNWMKLNGHFHVDIVKMDIEGSEYDVVEDWIARNFFPMDQLLIEWHFRWLKDKTRHDQLLSELKNRGWHVAHSQKDGQEMTFLRASSTWPTNGIGVAASSKLPANMTQQKLELEAKRISEKHGFVMIQLLNEGYINMTRSWICNVYKFEDVLQKVLFIATDEVSFCSLAAFDRNLNVIHVPFGAQKDLAYGQYSYYEFMLFRTKLLHHLLQMKITLWLVESDAVWLEDPTKLVLSTNGDMVTMSDVPPPKKVLQGGFQLLRPTSPTINVWENLVKTFVAALEGAKKGSQMGDSGSEQLMLDKLIREEPNLTVAWLPPENFASGLYYKDASYSKSIKHPMVILNNFIIGNSAKINRAKNWKHWFLRDNGTCTSHILK
jgi:FkbM family methyltransferase